MALLVKSSSAFRACIFPVRWGTRPCINPVFRLIWASPTQRPQYIYYIHLTPLYSGSISGLAIRAYTLAEGEYRCRMGHWRHWSRTFRLQAVRTLIKTEWTYCARCFPILNRYARIWNNFFPWESPAPKRTFCSALQLCPHLLYPLSPAGWVYPLGGLPGYRGTSWPKAY